MSYVLKSLTEEVCSHQANMTVMTHAAVSLSFSRVFTRDLLTLLHVLLTCQSLDLNRRRPRFFQMYFQEKNTVLYSGQYSKINEALGMFKIFIFFKNISYAHQRTESWESESHTFTAVLPHT